MLFRDLYAEVEETVPEPHVRFGLLRTIVNQRHHGIGEITVRAITYPAPNYQAHYVMLGTDRTSAYDEEFIIAQIRYCDALDEMPHERRFSLTKELMHVFDSPEEMTNTRAKFVGLMREIQNIPLPQHASPMYQSEIVTKWMAAIILCPRHIRAPLVEPFKNGDLREAEIAAKLQIPRSIVPDIMDDYYDAAFATLVGK